MNKVRRRFSSIVRAARNHTELPRVVHTAPSETTSPHTEEPLKERNLIFRPQREYLTLSYGTALDSRPDGKIVIFALPKSGNVWLVSLLSDYTGLPPIHPIEMVDRAGVGMCHYPYSDMLAERLDFLHGIYLVRDLRDVVVSYYHNSQSACFRDDLPNFHYDTIEEFYYEWFLTRVVPYHDIRNHAARYAEFGLPVIRYECLYDDPERELSRLIKRLGLYCDPSKISEAVDNNRLEKLQREGRMLDGMIPSTHFRKGGYGNYKTELPKKIIDHINDKFGSILARWGYER